MHLEVCEKGPANFKPKEYVLFISGVFMVLCSQWRRSYVLPLLTHWGRAKMAAIFTDDIFKCIFLNEDFLYFDSNLTKVDSLWSN